MRKILLAVCGFVALGSSGLANAGQHITGYVHIQPTYMYGSMNNRYNASAVSYIGGYGYINTTITFYGHDDATTTFSCYVPTTSALYAQAVDVKNNLRNGSYMLVNKSSTSSECTSIFFRNSSDFLD